MKTARKTQEVFVEFSARNRELINLWTQAGQSIFDQVAVVSAATAKEGIRQYSELQLAAADAATEAREYWLRLYTPAQG